jgi:uncharacterized membrane protein (UPF0127 family)
MRALRIVPSLALALALSACTPEQVSAPDAAAGTPPATAEPVPRPALSPSEPFDVATLTLRGPDGAATEVPVYVAAEPAQRQRGLMDRDELPAGTGMVFRFPADSSGAFYMYRTRIPLSIAFYDAEGTVVDVLDMEPCPAEDPAACPRYRPDAPYRGALEVNRGFFADVGLTEGWTVEVPPELPPPE